LPPEDKHYTNVYEFKDVLARAMAGRMAEKILYGDDGVTTGAGSDLKHAAELARGMVTEEGMGAGLRNQVFTEDKDYFGGVARPYSDQTAEKIDREVAELMSEATRRAEAVLNENRQHLDKLAKALLEKETLEEDAVNKLLKGATLPKVAKLHD
jgi:cell division protease FtsH